MRSDELLRHRRVFDRLLAISIKRLEARDDVSAAVWCQLAAEYAWRNPTGLLRSAELEASVAAIGGRHLQDGALEPETRSEDAFSVLHVLTEASPTGGHTRFAWRWVSGDAARLHCVALVDQGVMPVPSGLEEAVRRTRGGIYRLDEGSRDLISRAGALATLGRAFDCVVLHVHPHDIVPTIAFSAPRRRPHVLFMNHGDLYFWIGASVCDGVINFRSLGRDLTVRRRGIKEARTVVLPIPLGDVEPKPTRSDARARLGLAPEAVIVLTAAAGYKFEAQGEPTLPEAVLPLIQELPRVQLLAAGPRAIGSWAAAQEASGGRVIALGPREDVGLFYRAADIYLDSFPMTSVTSMLEAAQHGLPVLRYEPPDASDLLRAGEPSLDAASITARTSQEYISELRSLVTEPERRASVGRRGKAIVTDIHTGAAWRKRLDLVYSLSDEETGRGAITLDEKESHSVDYALARLHEVSGQDMTILQRLPYYLRLLPQKARPLAMARVLWSVRGDGRAFAIRGARELKYWIQAARHQTE